jgi:hypothetical protein
MQNSLVPPPIATELSKFFTWMGNDGICRTCTKAMAEVDLEAAIQNTIVVNSFYKNVKFPILVDTRPMKSITGAARKHFSTNGRDTKISAMALLVGSPISKVIGNFFIGLNKPEVPAKLFNSESDALRWLNQFVSAGK